MCTDRHVLIYSSAGQPSTEEFKLSLLKHEGSTGFLQQKVNRGSSLFSCSASYSSSAMASRSVASQSHCSNLAEHRFRFLSKHAAAGKSKRVRMQDSGSSAMTAQ